MPATPSATATIVKAGIIAGTLDITAATIVALVRGFGPIRIFRYIASAVFGKASSAGWDMVVAGLLFHYLIAFIWATIFYVAYPLIHRFIKSAVAAGLLYGIVVWLVMNLVVVPLSRVNRSPFTWYGILREMAILMVCIGLPIAIITYKSYLLRTKTTV
jgi:uncharacterized membrane protein YagU involved in acid resistance